MKNYDQKIKDLEGVIKIQTANGNWNYDRYMHGLANGLIMGLAMIKGEEPEFLDAPEQWLKDLSDAKTVGKEPVAQD